MSASRSSTTRIRAAALVVHRWVGLTMAAFLVVAASTGSVLSFFTEFDEALNPALHFVEQRPGAKLLHPIQIQARVRQQLSETQPLDQAVLDVREGRSVSYWLDERQTFVDPYTGTIIGSRKFGDLAEGKKNLLTFLYRLHYSLGLGQVGTVLLGAIAVLWMLDCFVGAYLTLPRAGPRERSSGRSSWFVRWLPAWLVKANQLFALVFTWHRASGLWLWAMLLVFAWSGVALNLNTQVYRPAMNALFGAELLPPRALEQPRISPKLDFGAALARGQTLVAELARRRQFQIIQEKWLSYDAASGSYSYTVESTLDVDARLARTELKFDGDDGHLISFHAPTSDVRSTLDTWLLALHFGRIRAAGMAYRIAVSMLGVAVTLLSVTGIWIWWRKRQKRARRSASSAAAPLPASAQLTPQ